MALEVFFSKRTPCLARLGPKCVSQTRCLPSGSKRRPLGKIGGGLSKQFSGKVSFTLLMLVGHRKGSKCLVFSPFVYFSLFSDEHKS